MKDVLRKYEGQDTHTVHLVCTSPQAKYGIPSTSKPTPSPSRETTERSEGNQPASNSNNTEGLRHRNVGETPSNDNQENANVNNPNVPNTNPYNPQTPYYYWNQEQADAWTAHMNQWATENNAYPPGSLNYTMPNIMNMNPMMFAAQVAWMQRMQQFQQYYAYVFFGIVNVAQ